MINDIFLPNRELIENAVAPKQKKMSASDHADLVSLLIEKDKELKVTMKVSFAVFVVPSRLSSVFSFQHLSLFFLRLCRKSSVFCCCSSYIFS